DGRRLAAAGFGKGDAAVRIWNATPPTEQDGPEPLRVVAGHTRDANCVAFSPDGGLLASGGDDRSGPIRDARTGGGIHALRVRCGGVSAYGRHRTAALADNTLRIWNLSTKEAQVLRGPDAGLQCVAYHPSGKSLATAGDDGLVVLWDVTAATEVRRFRAHRD